MVLLLSYSFFDLCAAHGSCKFIMALAGVSAAEKVFPSAGYGYFQSLLPDFPKDETGYIIILMEHVRNTLIREGTLRLRTFTDNPAGQTALGRAFLVAVKVQVGFMRFLTRQDYKLKVGTIEYQLYARGAESELLSWFRSPSACWGNHCRQPEDCKRRMLERNCLRR